MAAWHPVSLLLVVGSYLSFGTLAMNVCGGNNWDPRSLHEYCTVVASADSAVYRSPACSIYRLCNSSSAATSSFGTALCNLDRLFITLCADRPDLPDCTTFQRRFTSIADHAGCVHTTAYKLWSSDAVQGALTSLCGRGSTAAGCSRCSGGWCDTSDPLLTYAAICAEAPAAAACKPWAEFCARDSPAAASALCLPPGAGARSDSSGAALRAAAATARADGVNASPAPSPPPADPCIQDPTQPSCKSYTYPDSAAIADRDRLCGSMPDMPGCAIARACESGQQRVAEKYCRPFVLLATLCHDMPGMRGCESYKALCKTGSVVEQCAEQGPVPRAPTWSQARKAVFSACDDHPMAGCAKCTKTDCADPLASLADICHEMPDMAACQGFWAFCDAAGPQDMAEWCGEDDSKYLPSMLMYFHQRTQELLLWKEWRPRTQGQYVASVIAIVAMGVVATGLKTAKGALVLQWNHQRVLSGEELVVRSVWAPRGGQMREILAKAAFTGVSLTLDYFNMLIAMTFNVGFFCAVIAGYIVGSLLFSHVLENYAAILHQRRKDAAAVAAKLRRRQQQSQVMLVNGGSNSALVNGNGAAALATSDEDEAEEKLLMAIEGEGECNCVHSA